MTNYEAIMKFDKATMARFLDAVHLAGINDGVASTSVDEELQDKILDATPFDEKWLEAEAESAMLEGCSFDEDASMLNEVARATLRAAGISEKEIEKEMGHN